MRAIAFGVPFMQMADLEKAKAIKPSSSAIRLLMFRGTSRRVSR